MAKGKKTGGRNFPKGNTLGGRRPLPPDVKVARGMAYEDMCRSVIDIRELTVEDAKDLKENPTLALGYRAILEAYISLDFNGIKIYEDRLFGKAAENVNLKAEVNNFAEWAESIGGDLENDGGGEG